MVKYIKLNRNSQAKVDDKNYEWLNQWEWKLDGQGYAVRLVWQNNTCVRIAMHRIINHTQKGMVTDHINHDRLDNREDNLRSCTWQQNCQHRAISKVNKSGIKGVYWNKNLKKWHARIGTTIEGVYKQKHLGFFSSKNLAAKAYKEAAEIYYGEFAC
jgi:hypothetical protein